MSNVDLTAPSTSADDAQWVVCLCAGWCGGCREYRPVFEQVARMHPGLRFAWVDVEDDAAIADGFEVETFPTILIAGSGGTSFLGPLLPRAETLVRLLAAPQPLQALAVEVRALLDVLGRKPKPYLVGAD